MKVGDRSRVDLTAQPILIRGLIRYRFKRQSLPSLATIIG